ncbi:hypothetical protein EB118_05550 [bacterium]|nr:hypothetical protein [bacterium]
MKYQVEKIKMKEVVGGFTERDVNSKALLNTDVDSLLKYKIQKRKMSNNTEIEKMRDEVATLKNEMCEIKELLLILVKSK